MPFTLTLPKLSPTMTEGTITAWHKKEGEFVESDELIIEVATDKATVEHQALDEGFLRKILIGEGEEAAVGQPIAIFTESKEESISDYIPEGVTPVGEAEAEDLPEEEKTETVKIEKKVPTGSMAQPAFVPEPPLENYTFEWPIDQIEQRVPASPLARKLAKEQALDLSTVKGSGPGGRIVSKDLNKAHPHSVVAFGKKERPSVAPGSFIDEKMTPMRKAIATRLQESKSFIPHFYVTQDVDAVPMAEARMQLKAFGVKVTFNDFVVRACAMALREHPIINSGFNTVSQTITRYQSIDISVAVSTDEGLITPIVRHADYKNIGQLSAEVRDLAKRAREGKLDPSEYKGGSFSISNLGMYGIKEFQAIVNPPQAAILAVSGIREVPIVKNGEIVSGKVMGMSLSSDHRVIDGAAAAEFIKKVQNYLENPAILLL